MARKPKLDKPKAKPGPKPETIKIKEEWKRAIKRSLGKKKPPQGWPK